MKCEILCQSCAEDMEKRQGDGSEYPGEHIKYVKGRAKRNPYMEGGASKCDHCEVRLPRGKECTAMTIWADSSPNPYRPWECQFIEIKT